MFTTTFTNSSFAKLKKFDPGKDIPNTECELYIKGTKDKGKILIKKFFVREGDYLGKKLKNLNTLMYYKSSLESVKELILPNSLVIVGGEIVGYSMEFIDKSINLLSYLRSFNNSLEDKVKYLKCIGSILEEINNIKDFPYDFSLGDLHEGNFIIDKNGLLKVVDIDSSYISNNEPFPAKYLSINPLLKDLSYKYTTNDKGDIIPNRNTDIYCYIMIILNTLANQDMYKLNINDFFRYINYLEDIGINKAFLFSIERIYQSGDNKNPLEYLNSLDIKKAYQANKLVYKQRTGFIL